MRAVHSHPPTSGRDPAPAARADHGADNHLVPIGELFTASFVGRHTRFAYLEDWIAAAGLDPVTLPHLQPQARRNWDGFVRRTTRFPDWTSMLREAGAEWVIRRLGLIIEA